MTIRNTESIVVPHSRELFLFQDGTIQGLTSKGLRYFKGNVVVPEEIDGVKVRVIGAEAFYSLKLLAITLPNSIEEIQDFSLMGNMFDEVIIPENTKKIGKWAFAENRLRKVTILGDLEEIGDMAFTYNGIGGAIKNITNYKSKGPWKGVWTALKQRRIGEFWYLEKEGDTSIGQYHV